MKLFFVLTSVLFVFMFAFAQTNKISQKEKDAIVYMREEEKLARDVYNLFYDQWNMNPFGNIRQSEQIHMDRMETLILDFQLEDPVKINGDKPGVFTNRFLQEQYNLLVKSGSRSIVDALKAGANIEELDIADLEERIAQTNNTTILTQFHYLKQASENHLRAFTRRLKGEGVNYEPVILSKERFQTIITSENSRNCGNGQGKGGCGKR